MHRVAGTKWRIPGTALAVFVSVGFVWAQAPAGQAPAAAGAQAQAPVPAPGGAGRAGGGGRGGRGMTPSQLRSTPAEQLTAKFRDPKWKAPRTPWGHPDLQGEFSTDDMNSVPTSRGGRGGRGAPAAQAPAQPLSESLTPEEFLARAFAGATPNPRWSCADLYTPWASDFASIGATCPVSRISCSPSIGS